MNQLPFASSTIEPDSRRDLPRRGRRWSGVAVIAALSLAALSACGSDSESSEDAFCDAGDSLRTNVEGIADIDIVSGGTDAVTDQLAAIQADADALLDSGSEVAADEIAALETALDDVVAALGALGDDISIEAAQTIATSVGAVVIAAGAVYAPLEAACS